LVVGLDKESRTPTLPTIGGVMSNVTYDKSFIVSKNINDINYISEGFLGRYYYKLDKKKLGFWAKFGIAAAVVAVLAAAVVASVFTCGAAAAAIGATLASVSVFGLGAAASIAVITGITAAGLIGALGIAGAVEWGIVAAR
jgi:hypothetical protein